MISRARSCALGLQTEVPTCAHVRVVGKVARGCRPTAHIVLATACKRDLPSLPPHGDKGVGG